VSRLSIIPWTRVLPLNLTVAQIVKKFPAIYGNPKVHYIVQKSLPMDRVLKQLIPDYTPQRIYVTQNFLKTKLSTMLWICIGDGGEAPCILKPALDKGECSASRSCRFTPQTASSTHRIGGWADPRAVITVWSWWWREKSLPFLGIELWLSSSLKTVIILTELYFFKIHFNIILPNKKMCISHLPHTGYTSRPY
jgi:hypothetical protein